MRYLTATAVFLLAAVLLSAVRTTWDIPFWGRFWICTIAWSASGLIHLMLYRRLPF